MQKGQLFYFTSLFRFATFFWVCFYIVFGSFVIILFFDFLTVLQRWCILWNQYIVDAAGFEHTSKDCGSDCELSTFTTWPGFFLLGCLSDRGALKKIFTYLTYFSKSTNDRELCIFTARVKRINERRLKFLYCLNK